MAVTDEKLLYFGAQEGFVRVNRSKCQKEPVGRLTDADVTHAKNKGFFNTRDFQLLFQREKLNRLQSRFDGANSFDDDLDELTKIAVQIRNYFTQERASKKYYRDEFLELAKNITRVHDREWKKDDVSKSMDYRGNVTPFVGMHATGLSAIFCHQYMAQNLENAKKIVLFMDEIQKDGLPSYKSLHAIPSLYRSNEMRAVTSIPLSLVRFQDTPEFGKFLFEVESPFFEGFIRGCTSEMNSQMSKIEYQEDAMDEGDYSILAIISSFKTFLEGIDKTSELIEKSVDEIRCRQDRFTAVLDREQSYLDAKRQRLNSALSGCRPT